MIQIKFEAEDFKKRIRISGNNNHVFQGYQFKGKAKLYLLTSSDFCKANYLSVENKLVKSGEIFNIEIFNYSAYPADIESGTIIALLQPITLT